MSRQQKVKYTATQFIEAIKDSGGIISTIAARVGCAWHTAKKYIEAMPTAKDAYQDEVERVTDLAETKLIQCIKEGDGTMIRYYLSTKGKHRGYTERKEVTGAEGEPLRLIVEEIIVGPESEGSAA